MFDSLSSKSSADFCLRLAHANGNLDKSIGNSFVVTKLHQFWSHWDSEFPGHISHLIKVGLGVEGRCQSVKRSLGVHQSLELGGRVAHVLVVKLFLLIGSLGISFFNGVIKLLLHECCLLSSTGDSVIIVFKLEKIVVFWEASLQCFSEFMLELVSDVFSVHVGLR
jgi:hypothetical protein